MKRPPPRVSDEQLAAEVTELDAILEAEKARGDVHLRRVVYALGARTALEWVRNSRNANPMKPTTFLDMLNLAEGRAEVLLFKRPDREDPQGSG